jgi:hypothetical protein
MPAIMITIIVGVTIGDSCSTTPPVSWRRCLVMIAAVMLERVFRAQSSAGGALSAV